MNIPNSKKIILIRHCESQGNFTKKISGTTDFEVIANGENQSKELHSHLKDSIPKIGHIYSSDLLRAYQTAKLALGLKDEKIASDLIKNDESLREIYIGQLETIDVEMSGYEKKVFFNMVLKGKFIRDDVKVKKWQRKDFFTHLKILKLIKTLQTIPILE